MATSNGAAPAPALVKGTTDHASYSMIQDDSSSSGPFEGPEKLLELWFAPSAEDVPPSDVGGGERAEVKGVLEGEEAKRKLVGLRRVKREVWEGMLDLVRCKVLSVIEGEAVDAYLLSESSMFVWPHKLILKTCGTTTLLLGLQKLLSIAKGTCGFQGVWRCFYSRKTFMFPERQLGPHKKWTEEVDFLDGIFDNGSAYTVGKMNGDHWLLYITAPRLDVLHHPSLSSPASTPTSGLPPRPKSRSRPNSALAGIIPLKPSTSRGTSATVPEEPAVSGSFGPEPDSTLEILMSGLSPRACAEFFCPPSNANGEPSSGSAIRYPDEPSLEDGHGPGRALARRLGLDGAGDESTSLFGEAMVCDAFLFSPCGFSANLISAGGEKGGGRYATFHVTPEEGWSYASFECNIDFSGSASGNLEEGKQSGAQGIKALVRRIVDVFEPRRMSLTLFVSQDEGRSADSDDDEEEQKANGKDGEEERDAGTEEAIHEGFKTVLSKNLVKGYRRTDRIVYEFQGYHLVFSTFDRR